MECEPLKKATLTEQAMGQIAGVITPGQPKPGDKLPDERDLIELFDVTRSRIREALGALPLVGMLAIRPGDGGSVSKEGTKVPEEIITWMYHQEMNKRDKIYAARNLIKTEVYLTCYDNRTPEILERLDGSRDRLLDVETEEIITETLCQLLIDIDTYVGDVYGNDIYARLMQIMVLMRKKSAVKILPLASSRESIVFYHCKILDSFHQNDRSKVKKCLNDFFKYPTGETSIQE